MARRPKEPTLARRHARATILELLETVPATIPSSLAAPPGFDDITSGDVDWTPHPMARAVTRRRTFRWGFVVMALLVGAAAALGVVVVSEAPGAAAASRLDSFVSHSHQLEEALAVLDTELASGTDPKAATVSRIAAMAADMGDLAALPDPWEVVVDTGIDLDRVHDAGFEAAAAATRVAATSTVLSSYLASAPTLITLPDLPSALDGPALASLDAALAVALGTAGANAAALPESVLLDHRAGVVATISWLGEWREPYLEALRNGDEAAGSLAEQAELRIADLDRLLRAERLKALGALRDQVTEATIRVETVRLLAT